MRIPTYLQPSCVLFLQLTNKFPHASTCLSIHCHFSISFLPGEKRASSEQPHQLLNEITSSTQCCLRIKLRLFINIHWLNHHNQIPSFLRFDLLWNLTSGYIGKNRVSDPQKLSPPKMEKPPCNFWIKEPKSILCFRNMMWKKKKSDKQHLLVCISLLNKDKRVWNTWDKWSAAAMNSVSQEKWRGEVKGRVNTELMN